MPLFDERNCGLDGLRYTGIDRLSGQRHLPVRHATLADAIVHFGLTTAARPRLDRPLMARNWFGQWEPLGDRVSLSGSLAFSGPMHRPSDERYRRWWSTDPRSVVGELHSLTITPMPGEAADA